MGKTPEKDRPKPRKESKAPKAAANKRLTQQTRKLLGKHYASKYQTR
jgi:hypothetical protein